MLIGVGLFLSVAAVGWAADDKETFGRELDDRQESSRFTSGEALRPVAPVIEGIHVFSETDLTRVHPEISTLKGPSLPWYIKNLNHHEVKSAVHPQSVISESRRQSNHLPIRPVRPSILLYAFVLLALLLIPGVHTLYARSQPFLRPSYVHSAPVPDDVLLEFELGNGTFHFLMNGVVVGRLAGDVPMIVIYKGGTVGYHCQDGKQVYLRPGGTRKVILPDGTCRIYESDGSLLYDSSSDFDFRISYS